MPRHARAWIATLLAVSVVSACQEDSQSDSPLGPRFATDAWCAANPGMCGPGEPDEESDPSPSSPGYYMGTTITQAKCISATGAGISDGDHDGLSDFCEDFLAQRFRPALVVSPYDCNVGMEPYWAAKAFPAKGIVRIIYLFSYYQDCGPLQSRTLCSLQRLAGTFFSLNGLLPSYSIGPLPISSTDLCASHQGDPEFITVDLKYSTASQHWLVSSAFFSSHWGAGGDHSRRASGSQLEYPEKVGGYVRVWVAEGKHANYPKRSVCQDDGGIADTCESNYPVIRIRHAVQYNIGSARYNFINAKTCVKGGALVAHYPENYGTECFWQPGNTFQGWSKYQLENDASPYYTALIVQFECFAYQLTMASNGSWVTSCSDWGVST